MFPYYMVVPPPEKPGRSSSGKPSFKQYLKWQKELEAWQEEQNKMKKEKDKTKKPRTFTFLETAGLVILLGPPLGIAWIILMQNLKIIFVEVLKQSVQ